MILRYLPIEQLEFILPIHSELRLWVFLLGSAGFQLEARVQLMSWWWSTSRTSFLLPLTRCASCRRGGNAPCRIWWGRVLGADYVQWCQEEGLSRLLRGHLCALAHFYTPWRAIGQLFSQWARQTACRSPHSNHKHDNQWVLFGRGTGPSLVHRCTWGSLALAAPRWCRPQALSVALAHPLWRSPHSWEVYPCATNRRGTPGGKGGIAHKVLQESGHQSWIPSRHLH